MKEEEEEEMTNLQNECEKGGFYGWWNLFKICQLPFHAPFQGKTIGVKKVSFQLSGSNVRKMIIYCQ